MDFRKLLILVFIQLTITCFALPIETSKIVSAIKSNDIGAMKVMFEEGLNPNTKTSNGIPILHIAIMEGKPRMVNLFLEHGVNVDLRNNQKITALMYACADGRIEIVKALLKRGAKINCLGNWRVGVNSTGKCSDLYERTALMIACEWNHPRIVRMLLDSGANPNEQSNKGETALFLSVERKNVKCVSLLLKGEANPNIVRHYEKGKATILGRAVNVNSYEICKLLLEHGADVNIGGGIALIWAVHDPSKDLRILKLLLDSGCNVNVLNGYALKSAIQNGSLSVVRLLLEHDARMDLAGEDGKTALDLAKKSGNAKILQLMRSFRKVSP